MMFILFICPMAFGAAFLGIKAVEYHEHWTHHQFPGPNFQFEGADAAGVSPQNAQIYFSFYWAMTGLHALHMVIGIGLVTWITICGARGRYSADYYSPVAHVGLYWTFVG